jgi:Flp pilus assembly protein TadD
VAEAGKGAGEERLGDLLRTWEESPSPRVGLQLAEEHRRAGRHADARAVLERSLESHPGHLSSLVALGKSQLDLGEPAAAAGRFETVLERDPTHLVAGKLLIEAHLRRGDGAGARRRLEHYRLLNAGDPELEDLERRTDELEAAEPAGTPPAAAAEGVDDAKEVEAAGEGPGEGEAGAAGEEAGEPAAEWEPAGTPGTGAGHGTEPPAAAAAPRLPVEHGAGDPFGSLAGAGDERRWLAGLAAPGIFPLELPAEPEPPAAAEEPLPVAAAPEAGEPAPAAAQAAAEEPPPVIPEPIAEDEPAAAAAPFAPRETLAGAPEPPPPAAPSEPGERATRPAAPVERAAPAPVRAVAGAAAPAAEPSERATNTLGELYLAQGHLDDAERVFRAVLARRPDDAAAQAGLAEAARRRRGPFDAAALMRWAASRGRPVAGGDRTARSAAMLRAYLDRLHGESRRDVP